MLNYCLKELQNTRIIETLSFNLTQSETSDIFGQFYILRLQWILISESNNTVLEVV